MAKITPIDIVKGMTGKVSKNSNTVFYYNPATGKNYTRMNDPKKEKKEPTEKQVKSRSAFKEMQEKSAAWLNAHKPRTENPEGDAIYWEVKAAYEEHKRTTPKEKVIGNLNGFVWKHLNEEGEIEL